MTLSLLGDCSLACRQQTPPCPVLSHPAAFPQGLHPL
ncbi:unnamed protein product [Gulo gulo]|uniref:Uncharacterized protein n=1 Tax=Gulo gulo TaxID=48420 RepID=A0A9X9M0M5_GULGU|nr:unnamed protein product [Gulo gulo]